MSHNYSQPISTYIDQGLNFDLGWSESFTRKTIFMQENKNTSIGDEANKNAASPQKSDSSKNKVDPNTFPAAKQAADDIIRDPDLTPDKSKTADLDEGELARADNSND
jgi:hypothetical protein